MTRRDIAYVLPALGLLRPAPGEAQADREGPPLPAHARTFAFEKLPVNRSAAGGESRPVFDGKLPTGEAVELHETTLPPGQMPHPAHKHVHSELMLIREGTIEFIMEGRSELIGPGGVAYAASGELHGLKNVGSGPANYFVIAIGAEPRQS